MANIDVNNLLASLPNNVQDAIKALVAQELAKNEPAPARELTEREQVEQHLGIARASLQHAGDPTAYQHRLLSAIERIADRVFAEDKAADEAAQKAAAVEAATYNGGVA